MITCEASGSRGSTCGDVFLPEFDEGFVGEDGSPRGVIWEWRYWAGFCWVETLEVFNHVVIWGG